MYELKITAPVDYVLSPGSYDQAFVNGVSFTVKGFTGSITVQKRQAVGNLQNYTPAAFNCSYVNANTDAYLVAGTVITADGQYLVSATAQEVVLHVTSVTGTCSVVVTPVEGAVGASGGGASSAVTVADGGDVALGTTTDPVVTSASSAAATAISLLKGIDNGVNTVPTTPLQIVTSDSTGTNNANTLLLNSAPNATTTYGLPVMAYMTARNGTSANPLWTVSNIGADAITGVNTVSVGPYVWNVPGAVWDRMPGSVGAGQIVKPYSFPSTDWQFAGATGGLTTLTAVTIKAAAGAGIKNYVTALQISNGSTTASEVIVNSGAGGTTIWRGYLAPSSSAQSIVFPTPLQGAANTLLEVACVTTGAAVRVSAQGYTAA